MDDPIQHLFEPQSVQVQGEIVVGAVGQLRGVDPHPQVAQDQGDGDEQQPQSWIARAGIDSRVSQLAIARFDSEPLAIHFTNLGRRTLHAPSGEQQFFVFCVCCLCGFDACGSPRRPKP